MRRIILVGAIAALTLIGCSGGGATTAPTTAPATAPSTAPATAPSTEPSTAPSTAAAPTVVAISASDDLKFAPAEISVKPGAEVTFKITNTGAISHEFMVGPKAAVDADSDDGTAEIEEIGAGQTKEISFTFGTSGDYAFACHVTGHFEAGMKGSITLTP